MKRWLWQVFIAIDQLANALLGGWADETLSSRAFRAELNGKPMGRLFRPLIDWLFRLVGDDEHCYKSYLSEKNRSHLGVHFRTPADKVTLVTAIRQVSVLPRRKAKR